MIIVEESQDIRSQIMSIPEYDIQGKFKKENKTLVQKERITPTMTIEY